MYTMNKSEDYENECQKTNAYWPYAFFYDYIREKERMKDNQ